MSFAFAKNMLSDWMSIPLQKIFLQQDVTSNNYHAGNENFVDNNDGDSYSNNSKKIRLE